jgi:hypothetical protein
MREQERDGRGSLSPWPASIAAGDGPAAVAAGYPRSEGAACQLAVDQALQADPAFRATTPAGWLNEP